MAQNSPPRLGIPIERTTPNRRPGRWMPFLWMLYAALLAAAIMSIIHFFHPMDDQLASAGDQESSAGEEALVAAEGRTPAPSPAETTVESLSPADVPPLADTDQFPATQEMSEPEPAAPAAGGVAAILADPVSLEKRRDGQTSAVIHLRAGQEVQVVSREGAGMVRIRWGEAEGFVPESSLENFDH